MTGDTLQFTHKQADVLCTSRRLSSHQLFDGSGVGNFVQHGGEIVGIIHITDTTQVGTVLQRFLDTTMQVADDRYALNHRLPFQSQYKAQDSMRTGVLGSHIQQHLLCVPYFVSLLSSIASLLRRWLYRRKE